MGPLGLDTDDIPISAFRPDAYLIDRTNHEINIFEVEVSCALSAKKLRDYSWWWFCWDSEGQTDWLPRLFTVDRYGNSGEIDLEALYFKHMAEDIAA